MRKMKYHQELLFPTDQLSADASGFEFENVLSSSKLVADYGPELLASYMKCQMFTKLGKK